MDPVTLIAIIGLAVLIGAGGILIILFDPINAAIKHQKAAKLGFTPVHAAASLTAKINDLYQPPGKSGNAYSLCGISGRAIPGGEMYLFDLIKVSYAGEEFWKGTQVVAIISARLKLPHFELHPKGDRSDWIVALGSKLTEWTVAKVGKPVEFPLYPDFQQRYVVTSTEPDKARLFFNEQLIRHLLQTRLCTIRARGDIFTYTEIDPGITSVSVTVLGQQVERAMDMFRSFCPVR